MLSLSTLNYFFVLIYGLILSLSFANVSLQKNIKNIIIIAIVLLGIQIIIFILLGEYFLYHLYPFVTHLPLVLLLTKYYQKPLKIALVSVLTAYLLCTPRKWFGTLFSVFWGYSSDVSFLVQIIITIPLLLLIIKLAAPYITGLMQEDQRVISLFIYVPLTYYLLEYGLTVYSDTLYSGGPAVVEFLDSALVVVYFIFSVLYLRISQQKRKITQEKTNLQMLIQQSEYEIAALKEAQKTAAIYHHDMRHHFSLLESYLADGEQQKATDYIQFVKAEIEEASPACHSGNNTVNLILSSLAAKAKASGVTLSVEAKLPPSLAIPETEICALLANGLENAITAAAQVENVQLKTVRINCQTHKGNLLIMIENSFCGDVHMENGLPQSKRPGHGFGVKSMAMIAEKYNGYCSFKARDELFTVKILLPLGIAAAEIG